MNSISFGAYLPGLIVLFLYAMNQFNKIPSKGETADSDDSKLSNVRTAIRQLLHFKERQALRISPPVRANTTGFKYWLYRIAYALAWMVGYTVIIYNNSVRQGFIAIVERFPSIAELSGLDLTNGVVVAALIILASRIQPFRGMDTAMRHALYERASIPAQQLVFQYLLRDAVYIPDDRQLVARVRKALMADGFDANDIGLDRDPTTRSLWSKTCILMKYVEVWRKDDYYKTALALLRDPGSDKLTVERVREEFEALKSDARICLDELKQSPDSDETQLRDQQFRRDCKTMLDAIYSLFTHVALRSHYSYKEAIASAKGVGFDISGSVSPLPDKNDFVALCMMLFFVTAIPLSYSVGFPRAITYTGIYILAVLTPIYLAAEFPRLLRTKIGKMPPLAFPLVSGLMAGLICASVGIALGTFFDGVGALKFPDFSSGVDRLLSRSYPWSFLQSGMTMSLAVLMLIGRYSNPDNHTGYEGYQRWGNLRDAFMLSGIVFCIMSIVVIPQLHRMGLSYVPSVYFWHSWGLLLRPVVTSLFIGFFVPTWYRGNATSIREDRMPSEVGPNKIPDGLAVP